MKWLSRSTYRQGERGKLAGAVIFRGCASQLFLPDRHDSLASLSLPSLAYPWCPELSLAVYLLSSAMLLWITGSARRNRDKTEACSANSGRGATQLPHEIWHFICGHLDTRTPCALSLTCMYLNAASFVPRFSSIRVRVSHSKSAPLRKFCTLNEDIVRSLTLHDDSEQITPGDTPQSTDELNWYFTRVDSGRLPNLKQCKVVGLVLTAWHLEKLTDVASLIFVDCLYQPPSPRRFMAFSSMLNAQSVEVQQVQLETHDEKYSLPEQLSLNPEKLQRLRLMFDRCIIKGPLKATMPMLRELYISGGVNVHETLPFTPNLRKLIVHGPPRVHVLSDRSPRLGARIEQLSIPALRPEVMRVFMGEHLTHLVLTPGNHYDIVTASIKTVCKFTRLRSFDFFLSEYFDIPLELLHDICQGLPQLRALRMRLMYNGPPPQGYPPIFPVRVYASKRIRSLRRQLTSGLRRQFWIFSVIWSFRHILNASALKRAGPYPFLNGHSITIRRQYGVSRLVY